MRQVCGVLRRCWLKHYSTVVAGLTRGGEIMAAPGTSITGGSNAPLGYSQQSVDGTAAGFTSVPGGRDLLQTYARFSGPVPNFRKTVTVELKMLRPRPQPPGGVSRSKFHLHES